MKTILFLSMMMIAQITLAEVVPENEMTPEEARKSISGLMDVEGVRGVLAGRCEPNTEDPENPISDKWACLVIWYNTPETGAALKTLFPSRIKVGGYHVQIVEAPRWQRQ